MDINKNYKNKIGAAEYISAKKEIQSANTSMLRYISLIAFLIIFGTFILSFIIKDFFDVRTLYAFLTVFMGILCYTAYHIKNSIHLSLSLLYTMFATLIGLSIYLSIFISPENPGTIILMMITTIPLVILDKSWHVNLFIIASALIHIVLAILVKDEIIATNDIINTVVCAILGVFVGNNVRVTKLKNFMLQKQTRDMAELDFLTGLYNRRKMYTAIKTSENGNKPIMGVLLFDIDHFKGYNDNYGHQAGDNCLRKIGEFLLEFSSKNNIYFYRFGGEEFICFTYWNCDLSICDIAEQLRQGVYDLNIPYEEVATGRVTISAGYCVAEKVSPSIQKMITSADQALYTAKQNGRNRALEYTFAMESIAHCTECGISFEERA